MKIQEGMPKTQILGIRSNLRGIINYEPSSRDSLLYYLVAFLNRKSASTQHHGCAHWAEGHILHYIPAVGVTLAEWLSQRRERYPDAPRAVSFCGNIYTLEHRGLSALDF